MRRWLVPMGLLFLGLMGPAVFLFQERQNGLLGFPLDDAWIHQTYARSLADGRGWTYAGGGSSAGSTSPLWTVLQVPSFWFRVSPVIWSNVLGVLLLLANAVLIMLWIRQADRRASGFAFFFSLGEWHLVWAALSGMETILFCTWISLILCLFFPMDPRWGRENRSFLPLVLLGAIDGLGIWIRPEAVLLSALTLPAAILGLRPVSKTKAAGFILGLLLPVLLYFSFEFHLNGRLLPTTFFVKTAEYSALASRNLLLRVLQPWIPLLAGPLAALALFLVAALWALVRDRKWIWVLPFLWAVGHLLLYAVQLPATYQHGRYFLPVLPILMGYGVYGFFAWKTEWSSRIPSRIFSRALWISAAALTLIFLWIGARQFARDVEIIETEMVAASVWIRDNAPPDAVVAAHDIGALGFWGRRPIIDLGGVTDLNALELLSGRVSLREYLLRKHADLLLTMPDFYPADLADCVPLMEFPDASSSAGTEPRTLLYDWRNGCTR